MSNVHFLKTEMGLIAEEAKVPVLFQDTVEQTINALDAYAGLEVLWLVSQQGAAIMPVGVGCDPASLVHWLWRRNLPVTTYRIDTCEGYLERISHQEAESLAHRPPAELTTLTPVSELISTVNQVLERGCKLHLWGGFRAINAIEEVGDWVDWHSFFKNKECNPLMVRFLDKAIHYRVIPMNRDLDARVKAQAA